jgi:predicted DNA-binding protein
MSMERVQMLLNPQQRRKLAKLAKLQGKSIAEITRQAIDIGLEQMTQDNPQARWLAALEAARQLRESMRLRNGESLDIDVVGETQQIREARDAELLRRSGF